MEDVKTTIREYGEGDEVTIIEANGRLVIKATNEGGYCWTLVDLKDVIEFVKIEHPELL